MASHNILDIGSLCVECGRDTKFGSGLFVDRIGSDKIWSVNDEFEIHVDGYLCPECQCLECGSCKNMVMDYELLNNDVVCYSCLENSND